jgi:high affinity Mn2+ porin
MIPLRARLLLALLLPTLACAAQDEGAAAADAPPPFALHGQSTAIWQYKPPLHAAYSGVNSLLPQAEHAYSFTATLDAGVRLWHGAQFHLNPEWARGVPLSNLTGAGGISNGELARGSSPQLKGYLARAFLLQRFDVGGDEEKVQAGFNELGGAAAARRWTIVAGNFALLDYFDPNPYAKDPRTQFTNWSFLTHGSWDYAADARGYTIGALAEYRTPTWTFRFGRAMQPRESNGSTLDTNLNRQYGDQAELERPLPWSAPGGPMVARLLVFHNRIAGGSFADAIAAAPPGTPPDVAAVRRPNDKRGWGFTLQAPLAQDEGVYLRANRSDGRVETYAFSEIDRQLQVGSQFSGRRWGRPDDRWGLAYALNGLSASHRAYLALGGHGAFLGDGRLNYGSERVFEAWYRWTIAPLRIAGEDVATHLGAGFQHLVNPGYNRDRGPASTWTLRWHAEF